MGILATLLVFFATAAASSLDEALRMESPGWSITAGEGGLESALPMEGDTLLRLSASGTAAATLDVPPDALGRSLRLTGYLRLDALDEGEAGLWIQVDNRIYMKKRRAGAEGWRRLVVKARFDPMSQISVGAWVRGEGTVDFDDLGLEVDGRAWEEAPKRPALGVDADHRFDEGSGLTLTAVTPRQRASLARLAKVWGFVKMHHPAVREGRVYIDYELFAVLPRVLAADTPSAVDAVMVGWIDGLGERPACSRCSVQDDPHLAPDLSLLELDGPLGARLREVHAARGARSRLLSLVPGVGSPDFSAERSYADADPLDPGHRLLSVFRFWNIIEWTFPYRDQVEGDWDEALVQAIDDVLAAEDRAALARALIALHVPVSDTHTNLWGGLRSQPPAGSCSSAADVRLVGAVDCTTLPWSHFTCDAVVWSAGGGLEVGDVVQTIDDRSIDELLEDWSPYYPASNEPTRRRDLSRNLLRGSCGPMKVGVLRGDTAVDVSTERIERRIPRLTHDRPGPALQRLSEDVAYLKVSAARPSEVPEYLAEVAGTRGWVLDLRGYPAESLLVPLGSHLVREPTPFARFSFLDAENPGTFVLSRPSSLPALEPFYEGKVAILVDEVTQSAAEFHAMAFAAAPRARIFGSTTAGADGNVSKIPLSGGLSSAITGIGVFWPDGRPTQRVGIIPDVSVVPTAAGIAAGRDEVLEAATTWIASDD